MQYSGWSLLDHMIAALNLISEFMQSTPTKESFLDNKLVSRAVTMELFNFAELVKKTSEDGTLPGNMYPWREIIRFRDKMGHWYFTTNFSLIYDIVVNHLPSVAAYLQQQQKPGV